MTVQKRVWRRRPVLAHDPEGGMEADQGYLLSNRTDKEEVGHNKAQSLTPVQ